MNFYGHLTVASFDKSAVGYLLGSMLPDFAGMIRQRLHGADSLDVEEGIRFHHVTDQVFHATPEFVSWCSEGTQDLLDAGVRRGTAMAVAHVAPELMLDAWLAERFNSDAAFGTALRAGSPEGLGGKLRWSNEEGAARFELLRRRLASLGDPRSARDPDTLLLRVIRTLDRRPRLAVEADDSEAVARYLGELPSRVDADADALLDALRRGLEERALAEARR